MKKIIALAFVLITSALAAFAGEHRIAFERSDAVYVANLDGTAEKKIADGIFPAISPDGTQVAFNTVEKTSDTTYVRHIAVTTVATGKTTIFKDVPSDNSYYPTWSPDGKRILFTLRQNEVWDLGLINSDETDFRVLKKGAQNEVTRYSPIWARDGQSVFLPRHDEHLPTRQHSFSQSRARRKERLHLSNVCRRKKFETPDQEWTFPVCQRALICTYETARDRYLPLPRIFRAQPCGAAQNRV
jgi:dipeptidyl aminopeptidase/acylaminoacyl peptidase